MGYEYLSTQISTISSYSDLTTIQSYPYGFSSSPYCSIGGY